jgi:hypothetical protein
MAHMNNLLVLGTSNLLGAVNVFNTVTATTFKGDLESNAITTNTITAKNTATFSSTVTLNGVILLSSNSYGTDLPGGTSTTGRVFFKLV